MPYMFRTIADITPNTYSQDDLFQSVKFYSKEYESLLDTPEENEFMHELTKYNPNSRYFCDGDNLEDIQAYLKDYCRFIPFTISSNSENFNKLKAITWVRMIIAFNLYAACRCTIGILPYDRIDFIGSAGDNNPNRNTWESRFNDRCVLFISDEKLWKMIQLTEEQKAEEFWECIFEIYDSQHFNATLCPTNNDLIGEIAQEYLNRENEEEYIPSNRQIADMIIGLDVSLPADVRKLICELCVTSYISQSM